MIHYDFPLQNYFKFLAFLEKQFSKIKNLFFNFQDDFLCAIGLDSKYYIFNNYKKLKLLK